MHSLVVDDSEVVRRISKNILEGLGFTVSEAANGHQALAKCSEKQPELILLDWNMPEMDGLEFLQTYRQNKNNRDVKVVFCTTENDLSKIQNALESGADEYVMKPFDKEIIAIKLQQLGLIEAPE